MKNILPQKTAGASFLPEEYVNSCAENRANLLTLGLFALVMFGVVAAFFVTNRRWETIRAEQQAISVEYTEQAQKIEQLKLLEGQRTQMLEKAELTTALIEKVPRSVLLAELVSRMPQDMTLLELTLKSKRLENAPSAAAPAGAKTLTPPAGAKAEAKPIEKPKPKAPKFEFALTLIGVAPRNNDITDYMSQLQQCKLLQKVELVQINEMTLEKISVRRFEIQAMLSPDADARDLQLAALERASASKTGKPEAPGSKPAITTGAEQRE